MPEGKVCSDPRLFAHWRLELDILMREAYCLWWRVTATWCDLLAKIATWPVHDKGFL